MNRYLQLFFVSVASFILTFSATAQEFDLLLAEEFEAVTIPAGWVATTQDPALYPTTGPIPSGGWEYGVTSYLTGSWNVPTSIDASGFAISNDDQDPSPSGTDRSDDFLGVGFFDMTNYDSLTVLFDRFQNGQWGSVSFFYIANSTEAVIFPIPDNAAWFEDGLTIVNGQVLVTNPFVFDDEVVIGFIHNDNPDELTDGNWGAGLAVDNVILAGWLPPCEASGLAQVPASAVAAVGGSTTTISTVQNTGGEFSVVTNVQGSTEYDIAHSGDAYVTVRTGSASGPILAAGFAGPTPLTITTLSTDDLYLIWSDDQFCSSGGGTGVNTSTITGGPQVCAAESGALFAASGANACLGDELLAGEAIAPSVPSGYSVAYVVTDGAGNVVAGPFATPTYTPQAEGTFVIHTMVFDPADQATILAQVPNGALAVANLFEENGGTLCGSLDLVGAAFTVVDCPDNNDCEDATPIACGDAIAGTNVNASVDVNGIDAGGVWYVFQGNGQSVTFSTCDNADYDTRIDVFRGTGCADLEYYGGNDDGTGCTGFTSEYEMYAHPDSAYYVYVSGYDAFSAGSFTLSVTCLCPVDLDAGTLTADATGALCLDANGEANLTATEGTAPAVPTGYTVTYVLTSGGTDYVIEGTNSVPDFTVTMGGEYTIHTLVSTTTLDLSGVVLGSTTAADVLAIVTGDDDICAALDVTGTGSIIVNAPEVGGTVADAASVCLNGGSADIGGESDGNEVVPAGFAVAYVLTDPDNGLEILDANATGDFTVNAAGNYLIHTLVYDPTEITDFTPFVGQSATVVVDAIATGAVCAALDVTGASVSVNAPEVGGTVADATPVCLDGGSADIGGESDGTEVVPTGYAVAYVLTDADNSLEILDANATGDFTVNAEGNYIIHTLVYDPTEITDFTPFVGQSATVVVDAIATGAVCAALDVTGAPIVVEVCSSAPVNDLCGGAITVNCGDVVSGNTEFATATDAPTAGVSEGVWYSFIGTGDEVTVSTCTGTSWDTEIVVSEGACGSLTTYDSNDDVCGLQSLVTFSSILGTEYFIYVGDYSSSTTNSNSGDFELTVECVVPPTPPANDDCAGAESLTVGTTCSATAGDVAGATESSAGCSGTAGDDVWYSFVATEATATVDVTGSAQFDAVFEVFEGSCGSLTSLECVDNSFSGDLESTNLTGLTVGNTYYIRVYDWYAGAPATTTFDICVYSTPAPPANDDCAGAEQLQVGTSCVATTGDVTAATESEPGCTGTADDDVWFSFVADAATATVDVTGSSDFDAVLEVFEGACGSLTSLDCIDATLGGETETVDLTGLTPGNTYYIRVYDWFNGAPTTKTFDICVYNVVTGISESLNRSMHVYPNPSNGEFVVEINGVDAAVQLNVLDLSGRMVYTEGAVLNGNFRKDLHLDMAAGTYLLQIATEEGLVTRKIQIH